MKPPIYSLPLKIEPSERETVAEDYRRAAESSARIGDFSSSAAYIELHCEAMFQIEVEYEPG